MKITQLTRQARKALPLKKCGAVIVAAGSASRMGGIDKVMAPLNGEPMIARTVRAFQNCDAISEIVVVTREDLILPITSLCSGMDKVQAVVAGGSSRQESVHLGLNALSGKCKLAAIHDGARPLVTPEEITAVCEDALEHGASTLAVPCKDTCKLADAGGFVTATPDRSALRKSDRVSSWSNSRRPQTTSRASRAWRGRVTALCSKPDTATLAPGFTKVRIAIFRPWVQLPVRITCSGRH